MRKRKRNIILMATLFIILSLPYGVLATEITADHLEYFGQENKYVAVGNVHIKKEDATLTADKIILYDKTSDAEALGNVRYEDSKAIIITEKAEINIDSKTGKLYNALIFFKEGNYWITGNNLQKISENHYYANEATFTTCNPKEKDTSIIEDKSSMLEKTDWCFKGNNVDIILGERLTANNATYRIKGFPVLYVPYLWAPVQTERQTGFLFPVIGTSNKKGFQFSPSFFWAIDENKDATFYVDIFSKRGVGKGIEYRYLDFKGRGDFYAYHIRDSELKKDFFEFKAHNEYQDSYLKSFIDINYINHDDFFKEYSPQRDIKISRFLQSSGEVVFPFKNSRLYILGQYWLDLKGEDDNIPQRLPEIGYFMKPTKIEPFLFSMTASISNFYREKGEKGQRLDINPKISYLIGDQIRLLQSISLRENVYNLTESNNYDSFIHKESFEYSATLATRFLKRYSSFLHIIEPSLSFRFIPKTKASPSFDSTELFNDQSIAEFSIYNQFAFNKGTIYLRLTQPYDFNQEEESSLLPTKLEVSIDGPLRIRADMTYDFNKSRTETMNSELSLKVFKDTDISIGERYERINEILFYRASLDSTLSNKLSVGASIWYDAKGKGLRDSVLRVRYNEQCWATNIILSRSPGDETRPVEYNFIVLLELKGIGTFKVL